MNDFKMFLSVLAIVFASILAPEMKAMASPEGPGNLQETRQNRKVEGTVFAKNGEPLIGVSVTIRGTSIGTATDADGRFSLSTNSTNAILVFSYVGFKTQAYPANQSFYHIIMEEDALMMDEVVVTAMGIKKERKALGYSVQEIKSDELLKNKSSNVINSLNGKIAGVNITQGGGAAGAGSNIVLRGGTSLERDNQPVFVIDGIIYDNGTNIGGNSAFDGAMRTSTTYGNRVMDINPEDVESMSVLKGPAAAALYGSRAAAGVIVITTKKGEEGKTEVNFSSKFSSSWANRYPERQDRYKRGYYNESGVFNNYTTQSWGDPFGSGESMYNNIEDFFQNGSIWDNSVSISGGDKNGAFFVSASRYDQEGIVLTTGYDKNTFRFNGDRKYGNLTVSANVSYSIASTDKTLTSGGLYDGSGSGTLPALYTWARSENMQKYLNDDGTKYRMFEGLQELEDDVENPYWTLNWNRLTDKTNRFTGTISPSYKVADWFNIIYRAGIDTYTTNDRTLIAPGGAVRKTYQDGKLSENDFVYEYLTSNLMLNFNKTFGDFDFNLLLGQSIEDTKIKVNRRMGYSFVSSGIYSFENVNDENKFLQSTNSRKRLMGLYGELRASYKNIAYLTVTGRNDWTSTLPVENRSYFYPSFSGSVVFSELLPKSEAFSFGKIRASWAKVGKDTDPYATSTQLWSPREYLGGLTGTGNNWTRGNPYLKPEITKSTEIGLEMRFLNGRLGFDYTYYINKSENQIVQPRLSQTTGYILLSTNVGDITNKGMELSITGTPIETRDFTWEATLNLSGNRGKVNNLLTGQDVLYVTDAQVGNAKAASFNGGDFMAISGSRWSRNESGNVILDWNTGMPTTDGLTTYYIANREPKLIGGFNNSLDYKNWNLSFLFDFRIGGAIYNGTDYNMTLAGMSKRSMDRESLTITGVAKNPTTGEYENKTYTFQADQHYDIDKGGGVIQKRYGKQIIREYWNNYYGVETENFVTKTNWLRLRSVSLAYTLPKSLLEKQKVLKNASVNVSGNNLLLFTNYKGLDPETSAAGSGVTGSGSTGIDNCGVPATASVTVGVNLTF